MLQINNSTIQQINNSTNQPFNKHVHLRKITIVMKMIKSIILLSLVAGIMASCKNNYANHDAHGDKLAVSSDSGNVTQIQWIDTLKELGTVTEGQKLEVSFRFKNVGDKPLVIERVQPSCGCTVADPPKEAIAPGAEGVIKGVFDSNGRVGPNHKTMTVYANTAQPRDLVFNVVVEKKAGESPSSAPNH